LAWSPLASGFLADDFDLDALEPDDFRHRHPFAQLDLRRPRATLRSIGERHERRAAQVALAWVLSRRAIAGAIVGVRNTREAEQLVGAANLELDEEELREIESSDSDVATERR
jgi:aryl-alcohol dehydrogenase-like predicted oxidoreductase